MNEIEVTLPGKENGKVRVKSSVKTLKEVERVVELIVGKMHAKKVKGEKSELDAWLDDPVGRAMR